MRALVPGRERLTATGRKPTTAVWDQAGDRAGLLYNLYLGNAGFAFTQDPLTVYQLCFRVRKTSVSSGMGLVCVCVCGGVPFYKLVGIQPQGWLQSTCEGCGEFSLQHLAGSQASFHPKPVVSELFGHNRAYSPLGDREGRWGRSSKSFMGSNI